MRPIPLIAAVLAAAVAVPPATARAQLAAAPGPAAPITSQAARDLQQGLKTWLTEALQRAEDKFTVVFNGGITVEPQGDVYQAAIPPGTVTFADGGHVVVDRIDILLRPLANGWYDARWTLPSRYDFVDDRQHGTATLTIGSQQGAGVFAPEFHTFMSGDAALHNVVLTPERNQGRLAVAAITATLSSQEQARGIFDSTGDVRLSGIDFTDTEHGTRVRLGTAGFAGSVAAIRLAEYVAFAQQMAALSEAAGAAAPGGQPLPQTFQAMADLIGRTPRLLDGFTGQYWLGDVQVNAEGTRVDLGNAVFDVALSGLDRAAASFGITLDVGGLAIQPPPPHAQFIPAAAQIDLALTGLPNEAVLQTITSFLQSAQQLGPDSALMLAGLQLQQAVMNAGSQIEVKTLRLDSQAALVDLTGVVSPAPASPFGVTARASLALRGFEAAIAELRRQPDSQRPIQAVTLLQTMGTAASDAQGRPIRRYDIEVTPAGVVLMNGTDVRPLFEEFTRPEPQPQPGRR